jgi:cell division septation protein DedD
MIRRASAAASAANRAARRRLRPALAGALAVATALASPLAADEDLRRLRLVELEHELAADQDVYLFLDLPASRLAVKARGMELAAVELREVSRLVFAPLLGRAEAPPLPAPAVWTVLEGPGDTDRETIAPTTLRPYSEEEERTEPTPAPAGAPVADEAAGQPKSSYRVQLDVGWQLLVADAPPRLGWIQRFGAAVRDGWLRLRGLEPAHPPLVALVVSADDARLLHHLFRAGTRILVAPAG